MFVSIRDLLSLATIALFLTTLFTWVDILTSIS